MAEQKTRAAAQEAFDSISRAERLLSESERECGGGICLWHKFSPEQMGLIGGALIDARYAAGKAAGVEGY